MTRLRLSRRAVQSLIAHATKGYEELYKREVGGHLVGYREGRGFSVSRIIPYNTPYRTRSEWSPNPYHFEKKGRALETKHLKWIGIYHSHVEVAGTASTIQSPEDKISHLMSNRPIEIIIRIANYKMNSPKQCLSYSVNFREEGFYYYDICADMKDKDGRIGRIKVVE